MDKSNQKSVDFLKTLINSLKEKIEKDEDRKKIHARLINKLDEALFAIEDIKIFESEIIHNTQLKIKRAISTLDKIQEIENKLKNISDHNLTNRQKEKIEIEKRNLEKSESELIYYADNLISEIDYFTFKNKLFSKTVEFEDKCSQSTIDIDKYIKKSKDEIDDFKRKNINNEVNTAVNNSSEFFNILQRKYNIDSKEYLKKIRCTFFTMIAVVIILFVISLFIKDNKFMLFNLLTIKALVIFVGVYLGNIYLSSYKSSKHNEIINQHRENALKTFNQFITAAKDDLELRATILNKSSDAIFKLNSTGYEDNKKSDGDSEVNVVKIIGDIMKKQNEN